MPGNEERRAFADTFIQEHRQLFDLYARTFRRCLRPADVADLAADARVHVYQYLLKGGLVRTSASGLIFQATKHAAIDRWRKEGRLPPVDPDVDPDRVPGDSAEHEHSAEVNACLTMLPRKQRRVVVLFFRWELTHAEIGERLGISENNSRITLFRAVRTLKELLATRGVTFEPKDSP